MTEILIKRLSKNIPLPKYKTEGSSGMDLSANIEKEIEIAPGETSIISTGLAVSIPKDFEIQIRHTDTVVGGFSAQFTYTVQGQFNSIT